MTEYMTEQEQIQQLKNWVKQYGMAVLFGLLAASALIAGWHAWNVRYEKAETQAAVIYDNMLAQKAQNNNTDALREAQTLAQHYPRTPYADMALFLIAREAIIKKDTATALQSFDQVIHHSRTASVRGIARLREARLLIGEKQINAALDLLKKVEDSTFIGLIDEVRGDAYLAINESVDAKKAYQRALEESPQAETTRPVLAMKLANLI